MTSAAKHTAGTAAGGRTRHIEDALVLLDEIDGMPFDKVNQALDTLNTNMLRAGAERDDLLRIIDGMVLVCGRTGDAFCDFEEQAAAFHAETGCMRPGKDLPFVGGATDNTEVRRLKYNAWVQTKIEAGRAALAKTGGAS